MTKNKISEIISKMETEIERRELNFLQQMSQMLIEEEYKKKYQKYCFVLTIVVKCHQIIEAFVEKLIIYFFTANNTSLAMNLFSSNYIEKANIAFDDKKRIAFDILNKICTKDKAISNIKETITSLQKLRNDLVHYTGKQKIEYKNKNIITQHNVAQHLVKDVVFAVNFIRAEVEKIYPPSETIKLVRKRSQ